MHRVLALLLVLLTACAGGPEPDDPAPPPPAWSVELSTAPTLLALDDDDVWAASFGNGVGGSQVYRVDRRTGRRAAQRTLAGQPNGLVVAPDGALWLSTVRLPDQPGGTGLQVLDARDLRTVRAVVLPEEPLGLAVVDGRTWVGSAGGVRAVDGGGVGPLVPTSEPALRLLPAGTGRLLVTGPSSLALVDTAARRVVASRPVPSSGSVAATVGDAGVWTVVPDARDRARLTRHDPASLAPVVEAPSPGRAGAVAVVAGDRLWVTDPAGGRLVCSDAASGLPVSERDAPVTGPLLADDRAVVVATAGGLRSLPAGCEES